MTFEEYAQTARARHEAGFDALPAVVAALGALAKEREATRKRHATQWPPAEINRLPPFVSGGMGMYGPQVARRSAALDDQARLDADEIAPRPPDPNYWQNVMRAAAAPLYPPFPRVPCNNTQLAQARVAKARASEGEPVTVSHWGMHG